MTELNGIAADRVSAVAWALSSTFAGMAGVLIAPIRFNTLISNDFFNVVVVAIAAAAIGRLVSIPERWPGESDSAGSLLSSTPFCPVGWTTTPGYGRCETTSRTLCLCRAVRDIGLLARHKEVA